MKKKGKNHNSVLKMDLERFHNQKWSYPFPWTLSPCKQGPKGKNIKKEDMGKIIRWGNRDDIFKILCGGDGCWEKNELSVQHPWPCSCQSSSPLSARLTASCPGATVVKANKLLLHPRVSVVFRDLVNLPGVTVVKVPLLIEADFHCFMPECISSWRKQSAPPSWG